MTLSPKHLIAFLFCFVSLTAFAQKNPCSKKDANCKGTVTLSDGSSYTGEFHYGVPAGSGKITFRNGDVFQGDMRNGTMTNGSMKFANRNEYLGEFQNGKMHGQGAMILSNGDAYNGTWKNGEADGEGTYKKADGSSFTGNFNNGMRDGEGFIVWSSTQDTLFGNWSEDKLDGKSTFQFANGDVLTSNWKHGSMKVNASYTTVQGKEINGSMNLIYMVATLEDSFANSVDDILNNLQLASISSAMEFKATQNYDLATDFLMAAQKYAPSNTTQQTMIASQLKTIEVEKNNSGWARLPKK